MFDLKQSKIPGCFEIQPNIFDDERGRFVKVFHELAFAMSGLDTNFVEDFYSISHRNVIRGLHFQLPPKDHVKVVYCIQGEVIDVAVDLRVGSPTFGKHVVFELSAAKANGVYVPKGMAHGFSVLSEQAVMLYKVSAVYSREHDSGILWNSAQIAWGIEKPVLSNRDLSFSPLSEFISPFSYE